MTNLQGYHWLKGFLLIGHGCFVWERMAKVKKNVLVKRLYYNFFVLQKSGLPFFSRRVW